MTSGKSSQVYKLFVVAFFCVTTGFVSLPAKAQDQGYSAPAMFDDGAPPPSARPQPESGNLVEPKISPRPPLTPSAPSIEKPPVILPRVSHDPDKPVRPALPPPPPKPQPPEVLPSDRTPPKEVYIKRQKPSLSQENPSPPEDSSVGETKVPSSESERESYIRGPKTMPALPAANVHEEVLFEAPAQPAGEDKTILERHIEQQEKKSGRAEDKIPAPIVPRPKPGVAPADFSSDKPEVLKRSIKYQPGQIGLKDDVGEPLAAGVLKEMDAKGRDAWRVQIKSYATPHGEGISSDRRIALSRALSLRSLLISRGMEASRIDVLAEGLQSQPTESPDRIDLYLYNPEEE